MKYIFTFLFLCFMVTTQAQRFSAGILSGTGFSDYHGYTTSGKWQFQPGSVSGVFLHYSVTPVLGIGTEFNFTSQSYYYKPYDYYPPAYYYPMPSASSYMNMIYTPLTGRWDLSFYRVPLYLTLSTPTRLKLSVSAGIYVSFTGHKEYTGDPYYPIYYDYSRLDMIYDPYYQREAEIPEHDNGFMYAASLSFPVSHDFSIYAMGRYFIGHREFFDIEAGRTGASELALGFAYTGLFSMKPGTEPSADTVLSRISISPRMGIGISHAKGSVHASSYSSKAAVSVGLLMEVRLNKTFSLISGVSYERKGYRMQDSSTAYYYYAPSNWNHYADTRVDADYAIIPALLKLRTNSKNTVYITMGPYWGLLLNARVTGTDYMEYSWNSGYTRRKTDVYDDIEGNVNESDFGWIWGAGVELPLANGNRLDLCIQYDSGTKNIFKDTNTGGNPESDPSLHNASLNMLVGLTFPIHKLK